MFLHRIIRESITRDVEINALSGYFNRDLQNFLDRLIQGTGI
jgi:hypothetical protein